jgi:hypothetical protein
MAKHRVVPSTQKTSVPVRAPVPPPPPPPQMSRGADRGGARPKGLTGAPPELDEGAPGAEHRNFPRARFSVPFDLSIGPPEDRRFSAVLSSVNLSVSGAFLESTFFLPVDTELDVRFELDESEDPVVAKAVVVRQEQQGQRTGMAIKFENFSSQTEIALAKLFIGQQLRMFAEDYLGSRRAKARNSELERVIDALAAWELQKVLGDGALGLTMPKTEQPTSGRGRR